MSTRAEVASTAARALGPADPFWPLAYRVIERRVETRDVVTQVLAPLGEATGASTPGQFNMLTAFGIGEAAISISGVRDGVIEHTIRSVGAVSNALARAEVGQIIGVRGPFGTNWGVDEVGDADVVIVAGGIGLAPLKGVVTSLIGRANGQGRLYVLVGARSPEDVVFSGELEAWRQAGANVLVSVDAAGPSWRGRVGLVTTLIPEASFLPERTIAMTCGPEIMMRLTIRGLLQRGVGAERIRLSLERNMQCGVGLCGHCQLGPLLLCRDGPVLSYVGALPVLMSRREL